MLVGFITVEETFATESEAHRYFRRQIHDLSCVDNIRFAYVGNEMQEYYYGEAAKSGCCGSLDFVAKVGKNEFLMGCNYGH